ncbi:MAG TPA: c-type cytochrome [Planctomycetota bacterium]|nr:c-type cytochrome [Planctomycetota bacterium]
MDARPLHHALTALLTAAPALAQNGDVKDESQPPLPAYLVVPPAPALSAADELATFAVAPGFRVELVAAEPLVRDPVALAFDHAGRLWVAEMTGYMPDVDGRGEDAPVGSIAVLSDTDGDGRMDRRTVFLDELVLPRAIAPLADGALVIAPPSLLWARDTDGDGRADDVRELESGHAGIHSPEHAINGLVPTLDNAFFCANVPWRYRFVDGDLARESVAAAGQWGAARDDWGRVFTNTNSDALRVHAIDARYAARHPQHRELPGVNQRAVRDQSVRSARINPGVNRGYREGQLDADFHLATYTGACAPWIARGARLGAAQGDAFVCEPTGNLIARFELDAALSDAQPVRHARAGRTLDFLTSTDERFRPVALCDGPDGALYVADMYRGLIQHRLFVTSFLRAQVEARGLEQPIHLGRIWRVVADDAESAAGVDLAAASWSELAELFDHPSGWWRDAAQRIFVDEGADDRDAHALARAAATDAATPQGRIHALWALSGMGGLRRKVALAALADADARVRLQAVRASEPLAASGDAEVLERWVELAREGDAALVEQVVLSLGEVRADVGLDALERVLTDLGADLDNRLARYARSGLAGRELELARRLAESPAWDEARGARADLFAGLARDAARSGRAADLDALLALALAGAPSWRTDALLDGLLAGRPTSPLGEPAAIRLAQSPPEFERIATLRPDLAEALAWPGREGYEVAPVRPLDSAERARFERGAELYAATCLACHQSDGRGLPGLAPPLHDSPYVLGSPERLAKILLHGLTGPLEVDGTQWNADMPALAADDSDLAAVATYVRREWGHGADPLTAELVERIRAATRRDRPWTASDLDD